MRELAVAGCFAFGTCFGVLFSFVFFMKRKQEQQGGGVRPVGADAASCKRQSSPIEC
jgi:hypothetical protein